MVHTYHSYHKTSENTSAKQSPRTSRAEAFDFKEHELSENEKKLLNRLKELELEKYKKIIGERFSPTKLRSTLLSTAINNARTKAIQRFKFQGIKR